MKINNEKGHLILGVAYTKLGSEAVTILSFKAAALALGAACIWHMPAWDRAKDTGTEKQFQSQEMWPQQLFDKLPGGTPNRKAGQ